MIEPEEILNLPQRLAEKRGKHILICIDEFQQIGEFADSLTMQKRMRGVWQCQQNVSYCLFGSKKHMLENIFQNRKSKCLGSAEVPRGKRVDRREERRNLFGRPSLRNLA